MKARLLVKPLRDNLAGLLRKIDRRDDDSKVTQSIIDSIHVIQFETGRLDSGDIHDH